MTAALIERGIAAERHRRRRIQSGILRAARRALPRPQRRGRATPTTSRRRCRRASPARTRRWCPACRSSTGRRRTAWRLIEAVLDRVLPGGGLIQFSYGLGPPVKAVPGRFTVAQAAFVLANLPPARVWLYRPPRGMIEVAARGQSAKILVFAGSTRTGALFRQARRAGRQGARARRRRGDADLARRLPAADLRRRPSRTDKGVPDNATQTRPADRRARRRVHRDAGVQPLAAAASQEHARLGEPHQAHRHRCPIATRSTASAARRTG